MTLMFELLPYDYSDRSEFSEERLHGLLSDLNGEIIEEEERRKEPPDPESANHILRQIQQTVGQVAGRMEEVRNSVPQLAASPGSGVARLIFFGPPTTLLRHK